VSRKRLALLAAAVVGLAAAGLVAWLVLSLDGMVAREIERAGTEATGTAVKVAGVRVRLKQASGTIRRLRVANPKGFTPASALDAEEIRFTVDLASLRKDVLVVDEVVVSRPRLLFEVAKDGRANLDALAKGAPAPPPSDEPPRLLRIKRFVIEDGGIDADASALSGKREAVELKDIVLTNLGGRNGATSEAIAAEIVAAVRKEALRAVAKEGFKRYLSGQEEGVKTKAKEKLKGLLGR
jgi:hypothetical protein